MNSALLGFVADGSLSAPIGAIQGLRQLHDHEQASSVWNQLTGAAQSSKLLKRDPDALAKVITVNLQSAGRPTSVGIDADKLVTFFQNRRPGELNKFTSDMGLQPQDITNAASTGGSVDLPIGPYQAKYAGTDLDAAINQHIRFTPGGLSANELQGQIAHVKNIGESINAELAKTVSGEGAELPEQIQTMRDTLMADKLKGGMGYTADQADSQLAVLLAGLRTIAARRA